MSGVFPRRRGAGAEREGRVMRGRKGSEAAASSECGPTTSHDDQGLTPGLLQREPGDADILISDFWSPEL